MNYLICPECGSIYKADLIDTKQMDSYGMPCPRTDCCGNIFECDELLIPAILELNRKGYDIRCCCAGHAFGYGEGHIVFFDYMYQLTRNLPSPPEGWRWEKDFQFREATAVGERILRSTNDGRNMREKQIIITENANSLMNWAYNLEPLNHED